MRVGECLQLAITVMWSGYHCDVKDHEKVSGTTGIVACFSG